MRTIIISVLGLLILTLLTIALAAAPALAFPQK